MYLVMARARAKNHFDLVREFTVFLVTSRVTSWRHHNKAIDFGNQKVSKLNDMLLECIPPLDVCRCHHNHRWSSVGAASDWAF